MTSDNLIRKEKKPETYQNYLETFAHNFTAGGVSAAIAKTVTAPIERVKLVIQTQDANPLIKGGQVTRYTGIADCFKRIYHEQGFLAFWRGNFTNVIRYFPTQALNFAFKDALKTVFPKYSPHQEFWKCLAVNTLSGAMAGAGSLAFVYPLDYARTRLASDVGATQKTFTGLWDCLVKTGNSPQGLYRLYNGFGVSVVGIIPYRGVYFGMYDSLSQLNPFRDYQGMMGLTSKFAIAQITAITAGYVSYPFDTIRRRLQMQSEKPKAEWLYTGTFDCLRRIVKDEGMTALFKGAGANVLRTVGSALVLVLYDEVKNWRYYFG